jgi:hypothetical protein
MSRGPELNFLALPDFLDPGLLSAVKITKELIERIISSFCLGNRN